jgi:hypothetical protein
MVSAQTGSIDIFQDDWKACLRAHYFHVIHEQDWKNESSLAAVLLQTGISQEEAALWRREAMREIGIEEEIAEVQAEVEAVESAQVEITQAAELPNGQQPEPADLIDDVPVVDAVAAVEAPETSDVSEVPEITDLAEKSEAVIQAQMAFDDPVDNNEAPQSERPTPPSVEPPSPQQMSLF